MPTVSYSAYLNAESDYMGWCETCKEFTREMTEPDAEGYDCPDCGERNVTGAMHAMVGGLFQVEDEGADSSRRRASRC